MGADVSLKKPGTTELLATVRTLAALVVGSNVHAVGWHGDVDLFAMWTFSSFLVVNAAMCLPMSGEVAGGAVSLATVDAVVVFLTVRTGWRTEQKFIQGSSSLVLADVNESLFLRVQRMIVS